MTTHMNDIAAQAAPEEIRLSGFKSGTEISVKLRTPSLYALLAENAVPNPLLSAVNRLFVSGPQPGDVERPDAEFARALMAIAREALAEPTMDELGKNGVQLTDRQLLEIAVYATRGPAALAAFRGGISSAARRNEPNLSDAAEPLAASD